MARRWRQYQVQLVYFLSCLNIGRALGAFVAMRTADRAATTTTINKSSKSDPCAIISHAESLNVFCPFGREESSMDHSSLYSFTVMTDYRETESIDWCKKLPIIFLLLTIFVSLPAFGVDHPADYDHLDIPSKMPDADPRYFLSGGLCAALSHGITTPFDVVKTRIQSDPEKYGQGVLRAATIILGEDGPQTLVKGLGPTVLGYGLEGAAKFGLYESLKPAMVRILHVESNALPYLIASVVAGAAASAILCPLERTRIRMVTETQHATSTSDFDEHSWIDKSGLRDSFSGLPAMLSKQVPYTFGKQASYDAITTLLYSLVANPTMSSVKLEVSFVAAFLASILACLLSQPGDVILTETYKDNDSAAVSFPSVVSSIYGREGVSSFFSGLGARFLHVGAIITTQLVLYDTIKQALGLSATGAS